MPKGYRAEAHWLLAYRPPYMETPTQLTPEGKLWWAVVRTAAHDLRYGHKSIALDALEFLRSTGLWLLTDMFAVDGGIARMGIAVLVLARNRAHREPLDDSEVRPLHEHKCQHCLLGHCSLHLVR